ncbi:hypothetical protein YDYSG_47450 [Paenibacillus tyrfis]|uniref:GNAT family N-acetyltransferase n=1 Tax=Paenibacillus tyrfis TaxID=1501230 RepID=UPI0024934799|nr:GNAT family N-acetyltransferase [Paenibacillus tyrfis]GLI08713.1 hypothetical protein YDYSG_47450 [Paenibacillus tyrfis]
MSFNPTPITSETEIVHVLSYFNDYFPRSIESRVGNLVTYASKLADHACVFVTKDSNAISGVVIFYANDLVSKVAYLSHIAVSVEYQNMGIGSLLLQLSCLLSKGYGMTKIKLEVDKVNSKAIAYYEKHGFTIVSRASLDSYYMIKELT